MGDWQRFAPAVGAALAILIATLSNSWWTVDAMLLEVKIGLREVGVCGLGECQWESLSRIDGTGSYKTVGALTFLIGWCSILSLVVGTGLRIVLDVHAPIIKTIQVGCCAAFGLGAILAVATFPGSAEASMGWSIAMALVGSVVGMSAASRLAGHSSGWDGGTHIPVKLDSPEPQTPHPPADLSTPALAPKLDARQQSLGEELSYSAKTIDIDIDQLRVLLETGESRIVRFTQVRLLAARRLPPEAPYHGATFLDVIVLDAEGPRPIRILPSTRVNYEVMPGGSAATPRDNFRALAAFIRARNSTAELDSESIAFFESGKQAAQFIAPKLISAYDTRYAPGAADQARQRA